MSQPERFATADGDDPADGSQAADPVAQEVASVEYTDTSDVVNEVENPDQSITMDFRDGTSEQFATEADPSAYDNSNDQADSQSDSAQDDGQQDSEQDQLQSDGEYDQ